jgi:hypothetical protein
LLSPEYSPRYRQAQHWWNQATTGNNVAIDNVDLLTTATVGPLGTSDSASNVGADITIDFPDVTLFPSLQYYLRFTAGSQATTGNNVAIDNVDLFDNLSSSVLSSNFNNHGSPDGASVFTGIVWSISGISDPGNAIPLSPDAQVQTSGSPDNLDRLAVAWNIDTQGPWYIDIPLEVEVSSLTLSSFQFDYRFINGGGSNQVNPHPGSGVFTASILRSDPEVVPIPPSITLFAFGAALAAFRVIRRGAVK